MKSKATAITILLLLVVVFTLQNTEDVSLRFLFWSFSLARALMVFLILSVGMVIGLFIGSLSRRPPLPNHPQDPTSMKGKQEFRDES
ncbi:MAG: LapA family protein [Proteobacteria bacterium]|nr:LapA family protein [Pseudomonadota bacterium]MBU1686415.1 LapA family protein [Pseudomonadota bacterium]